MITVGVAIGAFVAGGIFLPKMSAAVKSWLAAKEQAVKDEVKAKL